MANKRKEVIDSIKEELECTSDEAKDLLEVVTGAITSQLVEEGDALRLKGLGTLSVLLRPARTFRNPATGTSFLSEPCLRMHFKESDAHKKG